MCPKVRANVNGHGTEESDSSANGKKSRASTSRGGAASLRKSSLPLKLYIAVRHFQKHGGQKIAM